MESAWSAAVVASIGLFASVLTASLSYFFTKRSQRANEERRIKEEFYRQFIKALSDVAIENKDAEANFRLATAFNTLLLIGSPEVVSVLMELHRHIKAMRTTAGGTHQSRAEHDALIGRLIKAMRLDLFGHARVNRDFPEINLVGGGNQR